MKKILILISFFSFVVSCSTFDELFGRREVAQVKEEEKPVEDPGPQRTTRKSLEEQSMLGEDSGSLWMPRGQSSYLFAHNNRRIIGDLLNVAIEGYPKEQIQTKVNVISKLLAQILQEEKEEIQMLQEEIQKKKNAPINPEDEEPVEQKEVQNRGLASVDLEEMDEDEKKAYLARMEELKTQEKANNKRLEKIGLEADEIKQLQSNQEFPIKSIPTRIVEVHKNGYMTVRGEKPFMIGRREYRLLVMGMVRPEDYKEEGVSAEILLDPTFDVITEKKDQKL